jgi:2-polyprenyl-3-methyl-5-hydroxy-6-metoxy-1,4-benzoquinol methylase
MNRDDWNTRYAETDLVWGSAPNRFVAAELAELPPGRALDLACGEGRNAVWLAERGWRVSAIDYSQVAIERAGRLAADRGVQVSFEVGDVLAVELEKAAFDLVLLAYLQLPPSERTSVLGRAASSVRRGGTLLLVGHDLRNHAEGHGGPKDPSVLWTVTEITDTLTGLGFTIDRAEEVLRDVEGASRAAIDTLVRARR